LRDTVQAQAINPTFEIAYNHYHNRRGLALPKSRRFIEKVIRPCLTKPPGDPGNPTWLYPDPGVRADKIWWPAFLHIAWETLTHAELDGKREK